MGKISDISALPDDAEYVFESCVDNSFVQKTRRRTVISLKYSKFRSIEISRRKKDRSKTSTFRSSELAAIVPSGAKYSFDLIAFVGRKCYLEGCTLKSVNAEIEKRKGLSPIPASSLYDIQRKFLFYLGELHRRATPEIEAFLRKRGNVTWLIDGTIEPGSPVFFGVKEAQAGIFLKGWKIPTENEEDISKCLLEAADLYGKPDEILHDLSERMINSCEAALPDCPHRVCHYHLCGDLGRDLYDAPQKMLNKRIRAIKLQPYLKNQRSSQTQRIRGQIRDGNARLILKDLLSGNTTDFEFTDVLAREILLGLHSWMLDYANDGRRQGFPFDPYLLYLHRRIAKINAVAKSLIARDNSISKLPRVFYGFSERLEKYLADPVVDTAANLYEKAFDIFRRIREVLRMDAKGPSPMRDSYELTSRGRKDVRESLNDLMEQFGKSGRNCSSSEELALYNIALSHVGKYRQYLFRGDEEKNAGASFVRTTNAIESHWGSGKRLRRQTHGRMKLARDFFALPAEYMLIPNLNNHVPETESENQKVEGGDRRGRQMGGLWKAVPHRKQRLRPGGNRQALPLHSKAKQGDRRNQMLRKHPHGPRRSQNPGFVPRALARGNRNKGSDGKLFSQQAYWHFPRKSRSALLLRNVGEIDDGLFQIRPLHAALANPGRMGLRTIDDSNMHIQQSELRTEPPRIGGLAGYIFGRRQSRDQAKTQGYAGQAKGKRTEPSAVVGKQRRSSFYQRPIR